MLTADEQAFLDMLSGPTGQMFSVVEEAYAAPTARKFDGIRIMIENPRGSTRSGTSREGKKWSVRMKHDYGFILRATGADGEGLDVFLGSDTDATNAYVIHQNDPKTGRYDEDKVMLGFSNPAKAQAAYLSNYDTPKFYRSMTVIPMDAFKRMLTTAEPGSVHWKRKHGRDHDDAAMFSVFAAAFEEKHPRDNGGQFVGKNHKAIGHPEADSHANQFMERLENNPQPMPADEEVGNVITGDGEKGYVTNAEGELAAAISWEQSGGKLKINHLGSLEKGGGSRAVTLPVNAALRAGTDLYFESTPDAVQFYRELGFVETGRGDGTFDTPHSELKAIQNRLKFRIDRFDNKKQTFSVFEAAWEEDKHPRAQNGRFGHANGVAKAHGTMAVHGNNRSDVTTKSGNALTTLADRGFKPVRSEPSSLARLQHDDGTTATHRAAGDSAQMTFKDPAGTAAKPTSPAKSPATGITPAKAPPPTPHAAATGSHALQACENNWTALRQHAVSCMPAFDGLADVMAEEIGGAKTSDFFAAISSPNPSVIVADIKKEDRAARKAFGEYKNSDGTPNWLRVSDLVRGTIAVESAGDVARVFKSFKENAEKHGFEVIRTKDRFAKPTMAGYRDILMNIRGPNGHIAEMQINTKAMLRAKGHCHPLYEVIGKIEEQAHKEHRSLTPDEYKRIKELNHEMATVYDAAWKDSQ